MQDLTRDASNDQDQTDDPQTKANGETNKPKAASITIVVDPKV